MCPQVGVSGCGGCAPYPLLLSGMCTPPIQAHFRGFLLRKRLHLALDAVQGELFDQELYEDIKIQEYPVSILSYPNPFNLTIVPFYLFQSILDDIRPSDTPIDATPPDSTPLSVSDSDFPNPMQPSDPPTGPTHEPAVPLYGVPGSADMEVTYSKWKEASSGYGDKKVSMETYNSSKPLHSSELSNSLEQYN